MDLGSLKIRQLIDNDCTLLAKIAQNTYSQTYSPFLTIEEINHRLNNTYSTKSLRREMQLLYHAFFGVFSNETMVGYLHVELNSPKLVLHKIYLDQSLQRKGFGSEMLKEVEQIALDNSLKIVNLKCYDQNKSAIAFYKKNGYRVIGELPFAILEGYGRVDVEMEKVLTPS